MLKRMEKRQKLRKEEHEGNFQGLINIKDGEVTR